VEHVIGAPTQKDLLDNQRTFYEYVNDSNKI